MGRSFALSALVHIVLAATLILGVRWQVRAPDVVEVDLVAAPPAAGGRAAQAAAQGRAAARSEAATAGAESGKAGNRAAGKAQAEAQEPEVKPKPKADPDFQKRLREQVAQEQKSLDQQRQERELRDLLARKQAEADRAAASARAKALNEYMGRIQASIRRNIPTTAIEGIPGNPEAVFDVVQLPTGEVISVKMRKSSGHPRYDEAIERAILKASPLPPPPSRELFERELKLTFRPQDK